MIVLDTNVVSESMRRLPDEAVVAWLDLVDMDHFDHDVRGQMGFGIDAPDRRRLELENAFDQLVKEDRQGRVQSFDMSAPIAAGSIGASSQGAGRGIEVRDRHRPG